MWNKWDVHINKWNDTIFDNTREMWLSGVLASDVAAGGAHTCALATGGDVLCWGYNDLGELGIQNTTTQFSPVVVSGMVGHIWVDLEKVPYSA